MKIVLNDKEIAELNRVASIIANDSDIFTENEVIKKDYEDTLDKMFGLLMDFGRRHGFEDVIE